MVSESMCPNSYQEKNEDEFDFIDNDDYAGLGASARDRPTFEEPAYKYAKSMSASPYRVDAINYIRYLPITQRYKKALYSCIYSLFTEEQVLANNNPRRHGKFTTEDPLSKNIIFAQRNIEFTRCEATKDDMQAFNFMAMEKYVLSVYEAFVSRTIGDKRERIINSELSTRNISQNEIVRAFPASEPMKKRRNFLGIRK